MSRKKDHARKVDHLRTLIRLRMAAISELIEDTTNEAILEDMYGNLDRDVASFACDNGVSCACSPFTKCLYQRVGFRPGAIRSRRKHRA